MTPSSRSVDAAFAAWRPLARVAACLLGAASASASANAVEHDRACQFAINDQKDFVYQGLALGQSIKTVFPAPKLEPLKADLGPWIKAYQLVSPLPASGKITVRTIGCNGEEYIDGVFHTEIDVKAPTDTDAWLQYQSAEVGRITGKQPIVERRDDLLKVHQVKTSVSLPAGDRKRIDELQILRFCYRKNAEDRVCGYKSWSVGSVMRFEQ